VERYVGDVRGAEDLDDDRQRLAHGDFDRRRNHANLRRTGIGIAGRAATAGRGGRLRIIAWRRDHASWLSRRFGSRR
jgi:hypothetical protein